VKDTQISNLVNQVNDTSVKHLDQQIGDRDKGSFVVQESVTVEKLSGEVVAPHMGLTSGSALVGTSVVAPPMDIISRLAVISTTAATVATIGSVVPIIGTGAGALVGACVGFVASFYR